MTTWEATQSRIVREATETRPLKVAVTIVSFPFFLLGWLIGFLWFVGALIWQAGWVGCTQARSALKRD